MKLSLLHFLLVVLLLAGLARPARASAPSPSSPLYAEWLENVNIGRPSNRTTVVRIAALGMALALFIMFRSKH